MNSTAQIVWKTPPVSEQPRLSAQKLRALERVLFGIQLKSGTERGYTVSKEPGFMDLLHAFYHSSDEKQVGAELVRRHIVPTLQKPKAYMSIGCGEGVFSSSVLAAEQFKEAILVDRNEGALKTLGRLFSRKFENKKPGPLHNLIQAVKISNGYDPCKPHVKYSQVYGEFPKGHYEQYAGTIADFDIAVTVGLARLLTIQDGALSADSVDGPCVVRATLPVAVDPSAFRVYRVSQELPQADLVCLDHMLYFHPPEQWVELATKAYQLVKPGGALVILVHGDALFNAPNEVANIIEALGGTNDDINGFAMKLTSSLPDARFEFLATQTRHWAHSENSMAKILEFFMLDSEAKASYGQRMDYINQNLHLKDEGIFECVKADKFIVAYKKNGYIPPMFDGMYVNPFTQPWNTVF